MNSKNILVIGLGSMGKRRIRNLKSLGVSNTGGVDQRPDRREEAERKYGIQTFSDVDSAITSGKYDAWIVSVPPDQHHIYMKKAIALKIPVFVEASVVDTEIRELIHESKKNKTLIAPSCTLFFHPAIKLIDSFLKRGDLGKLSNIVYQSGQYLPDWHTYEKVNEYYVSNKATGGAREIVPFELSWITKLIGFPSRIVGMFKKTINIIGAESIDDTYNILFDYKDHLLSMTVDVVSRYATRRLVINGDKKQLVWDWNENNIRVYEPEPGNWVVHPYEVTAAEPGYNKNIGEQMYLDEMNAFLSAAFANGTFPNTLEYDHKVLSMLYEAENSFLTNTIGIIN